MNRRAFLSWGTAGAAALVSAVTVSCGALLRFLVPSVFYEPPQTFKIGLPADFPYGSPTLLPDEKVFVFRDRDKGFSVVSAVCPHLGCTITHATDQEFHCPCHGSIFSANGSVLHGPSPRPLEWYQVSLARDGQLVVDKDKAVSPAYRLMV